MFEIAFKRSNHWLPFAWDSGWG